jgi:CysZ protein
MRRNRMMHYFLFPILISVIVFIGLFAVRIEIANALNALLIDALGIDITQDGAEGVLAKSIEFIVFVIVWIAVLFIFWTLNKYIVLIVLSPMLAILSERTEELLTGTRFPFSMTQMLSDTFRGVIIAIRNMILELFIVLLFTVLGIFIPIISPLLFLILFIVSAYFYGFSMMDYINERHKLSVREGVNFIRRNRGLAFANGAIFDLLMRIPVVGTTFAPILGCVGATLAVHQKYNLTTSIKSR